MIIMDFQSIYASVTVKGDVKHDDIGLDHIDHVEIIDPTVKQLVTAILCLDKHKNISRV